MFTDTYFPRINGVSISVKSYADELSDKGNQILIICCDYNLDQGNKSSTFLEQTTNPNINIYRVSSLPVVLSKEDKLARLSQWRKIKNQLNEFQPNIIHINSEFSIGLSGLVYGTYKKVPIVFTFHTLWEEYASNYLKYVPDSLARSLGRNLVKHYLKRADEIIVPTERIAQVVKRYGIEKQPDILPTGIPKSVYTTEPEKFKKFKKELLKLYPQLENSQILLYVGRIAKEKNLDFLLEVFTKIQKTHPETILMFVGGGPYLETLKQLSLKTDYSNKIIFTDYCDRIDLPYFYNISNTFVFPSITETQGLVTVEAMMSGTPVVAIGKMGTVDIMKGNNGGFMVEENVDDFTDKVLMLLEDKELHHKKSQEALEWSKKWSIKYLTPKLISYYEKAIKIKKDKADSRT